MDIIVLPVWYKGPYGLFGLYGHLRLTYSDRCVVQGCLGLTMPCPYCLRACIGYDRV
jgi:hypothetical protein